MSDFKNSWKSAGVGLGHAFRDLGKAFAVTAKTGIRKLDEWANKEDEEKNETSRSSEDEQK